MKVEELKIGDLVKCGGRVVKITALGDSGVCISDLKNISESWVNYINLTPIPLTKEILEKNGWKEDCYFPGDRSLKTSCGTLYLYFCQCGKVKDKICCKRDVCWKMDLNSIELNTLIIYYVHQLQHILWTLGLNDNLRI